MSLYDIFNPNVEYNQHTVFIVKFDILALGDELHFNMTMSHQPRLNVSFSKAVHTRNHASLLIASRTAFYLAVSKHGQIDTLQFNPLQEHQDVDKKVQASVVFKVSRDPAETVGQLLERTQNLFSGTVTDEKSHNLGEYMPIFECADLKLLGSSSDPHVDLIRLHRPYDIGIRAEFGNSCINITADFNTTATSSATVQLLLDLWGHILDQLLDANNMGLPVSQINYMTPHQKAQIEGWNSAMLEPVNFCIHDLVAWQAAVRPGTEAICAWDGNFSYQELSSLSTKLASHLTKLGVRPNTFVAMCFSKSAWAVVAMVAIVKAGGAFVAIDPIHPRNRIRAVLAAAGSSLVLAAPQHVPIFEDELFDMPLDVVPVYRSFIKRLDEPCASESSFPPLVSPSDAVYMICTSGSTGTPKSIIVEHRALATAISGLAEPMHIDSSSRVFQFASYTFDVSISDIFTTLTQGGCLCIPSERDRINDLAGAIVRLDANNACLTPTVARLLRPEDVPCLKYLSLGGESLRQDNFDLWAGHVRLTNIYGPSECTTWCAANVAVDPAGTSSSNCIGRGLRASLWIVDQDDHSILCPIGCTGELLVEGPVLARGYADEEQTKEMFIWDPAWAVSDGGPGRRFYKTGDLVKYNPDGTINFVGRKDSQVKVRGNRIEIGEIEYHLAACVGVSQCLVVLPSTGPYREQLVGVLSLEGLDVPIDSLDEPQIVDATTRDEAEPKIREIREALSASLPSYMIPQSWLVVKTIPLLLSGKMNRRMAKQFVEDLVHSTSPDDETIKPSTPIEVKIGDLWSSVLSVDQTLIQPQSHFFEMGGNSLSAMQLVALAERQGLSLTVADVFAAPMLSDLAKRTTITRRTKDQLGGDLAQNHAPKPFELICGPLEAQRMVTAAQQQYPELSWSRIQDIYPATPLQAGLMTTSVANPGTYTFQHVYKLPKDMDSARFRAAWEAVVRSTAILRIAIAPLEPYGPCQVVLNTDIRWLRPLSLESYLIGDAAEAVFSFGESLNRFAITADGQYFIWTAHHATYDGVSTGLVLRRVEDAYYTASNTMSVTESPSILGLVRYVESQKTEWEDYWKTQLEDAPAASFPALPSATYQPRTDTTLEKSVILQRQEGGVTTANLVRAGWALVLARYSSDPDSDDVVFGTTNSGRAAPVSGITEMVGPTIATVPVRVKIDRQEPLLDYLRRIQDESAAMIPFEQTGLQHISSLGRAHQQACRFQNLLVVQPPGMQESLEFLGLERIRTEASGGNQEILTYALKMECELREANSEITLRAVFDSHVMTERQVSRLLRQFGHVLQQLATLPRDSSVGDVSLLCPEDMQELAEWNSVTHTAVERSIPELFGQVARAMSTAPAIHSWDGSLTYGELDTLSAALAMFLVDNGVKSGVIVPVCFNKSVWAVVAMLSVMRAGAAYVALEPGHPQARVDGIIRDVGAHLVMAAPQHAQRFQSTAVNKVVALDEAFINSLLLSNPAVRSLLPVKPTDLALVVFTSGSTGTPKGILIQHRNLCTFIAAYSSKCGGIGPGTRIFQFAAYVFDLSVGDIFTSLTTGACITIPSEQERMNDVAGAINRLNASSAFLTPTVASLIKPEDVPGLKTVVLAGEAPSRENLGTWAPKVNLFIGYGPAETTVICSVHGPVRAESDPSSLGYGLASNMWIVDKGDHDRLAPIGCVGEVVVEGPLVSAGYLNDPKKTAAVYVENPSWAADKSLGFVDSSSSSSRPRRFYKTGDLARYNDEGMMSFFARKDTQVKVRGQRVELGEIEYHIYSHPDVRHAVAMVPSAGPFKGRLVAMLVVKDTQIEGTTPAISESITIRRHFAETTSSDFYISQIHNHIVDKLPSYMVPSTFVIVNKVPLNTNGKVYRQEIKGWFETMDDETARLVAIQLSQQRSTSADTPTTENEKLVLQVCSQVLKIEPPRPMSMDHSFLRLGGDSITAMLVASRCRAQGVAVTVGDILRSKTLRHLAASLVPAKAGQSPRSQLLTNDASCSKTSSAVDLDEVAALLGLSGKDDIEEAYPCTPVQNGMLMSHARDPRLYEVFYVLEVSSTQPGDLIDIGRLEQAWHDVVARQPAMRSVFFESPSETGIFHQAVLRSGVADVAHVTILSADDDDEPVAALVVQGSRLDISRRPPCRLTICTTPSSGKVFIKVDILHTISDGTTWDNIFKELNLAYEGTLLATPPAPRYSAYTSYLASQRRRNGAQTLEYWKQYLRDARPCRFPCQTDPDDKKPHMLDIDISFHRGAEVLRFCKESGITVSNMMQTAWALVLRAYTNQSEQVCFGYVASGRDVPLCGIDEAIGTYIGQLACVVDFTSAGLTVEGIARRIQDEYLNGLQYQHVSLAELFHSLGSGVKGTGRLFNTNVHLMRVVDPTGYRFSTLELEFKHTIDPSEYDITFGTWVSDHDVSMYMSYWSTALSRLEAERLSCVVTEVLNSILDDPRQKVASFQLPVTEADHRSLQPVVPSPPTQYELVHELSANEMELRKLWASVLAIQETAITPDANFLHLGGDSFVTMKLVKQAKDSGFAITFADVLSHPLLADMARCLTPPMPQRRPSSSSDDPSDDSASPFTPEHSPSLSESDISLPSSISDTDDEKMPDTGELLTLEPQRDDFPRLLPTTEEGSEFVHLAQHEYEQVLPATLVQQSMLASQTRSNKYYNFRAIWDVPLSVDALTVAAAWRQVVNTHSVLRTIFAAAEPNSSGIGHVQIVLKHVEDLNVQFLEGSTDRAGAMETLKSRPRLDVRAAARRPAHELVIYTVHDDNRGVLCSLTISHALMDGVSLSLLLRDFYHLCKSPPGTVLPTGAGTPYTKLASWIHDDAQMKTDAIAFWETYLHDMSSCNFPTSSSDTPSEFAQIKRLFIQDAAALKQLCQTAGVTASTAFRAAWALTLAQWANSHDVSFGHVLSGRDAPIQGIDTIVGPVLNILPCRVDLGSHRDTESLLNHVQADFLACLPYQFWSTAQVKRVLDRDRKEEGWQFFNTLFNFRFNIAQPPSDGEALGGASGGKFELLWSEDPMDYDVVLAIQSDNEGRMEIELSYWEPRISEEVALHVMDVYERVVGGMVRGKGVSLPA
ncbi:hypothetical protein B0H66DRAFT_631298 [Apodospora peruviana]|uniref:Carrier domain-containing protein n=1 Tax=Apodospora peruviana TaxID=516989 RepID=A0AAE0HTZ3_9PEZI|nr:hypothetical protein B0H66DRAFT_631298 [Apodospora peruviana]